jgi:ABC-2 type transport system permease protein
MIGQTKATDLIVERAAARGQSAVTQMPVEVRTQVWYNPDLLSSYYMIPALIGLILMFMTTLLTSTSIVRERERGTIEQLIVTPLSSAELVVGKMAPYVLIAVIDMIEILVAGVLIFGVPINGSLPLLLLLAGLFLVSTLGLGLFVSTLANTQQEAMLTSWFFLLPAMFLSGFLFPLEGMPWYLQAFSYVVPLRYFLVIVRGIMLKGVSVDVLWTEIIALSIFAVAIMGSAALRFRKRLD